MTLTASKKTGIYSAMIQTDHGRRAISTGTRDKREAAMIVKQSKIKELESAAKVQRLTGTTVQQLVAGKKVTVSDAQKGWIEWMENYGQSSRTVDNLKVMLESWVRDYRLADKLPSQIAEKQVDAWVNALDEAGYGTRKIRLSTVKSFYKFCTAKAYCLGNPALLVRIRMNQLTHAQKEPKVVQAFTVEELDKLTAQTSGFWRVAIAIGRWTGLRLGDICQLEWDCIDGDRMVVFTDKRDRRVSLPLTLAEFRKDAKAHKLEVTDAMVAHFTQMERDFLPVMRSLIPSNPRFVFPEQQTIAIEAKRRSVLSVQFRRICDAAGIEKSFHSCRHHFVSTMDSIGVPVLHIARTVGHRHSDTTQNYIHRD